MSARVQCRRKIGDEEFSPAVPARGNFDEWWAHESDAHVGWIHLTQRRCHARPSLKYHGTWTVYTGERGSRARRRAWARLRRARRRVRLRDRVSRVQAKLVVSRERRGDGPPIGPGGVHFLLYRRCRPRRHFSDGREIGVHAAVYPPRT